MNVANVIFGCLVTFAGLNTQFIWHKLRRDGKFRLDDRGQPKGFRKLTNISWLITAMGLITIATGLLT